MGDWRADVAKLFEIDANQLESLAGVLDDVSCWFTGTDLPGTSVIHLPVPEDTRRSCYLSRAPAGSVLPRHRHEARERVLVLRGGFTAEDGTHVVAGELLDSAEGTEHSVRMDPECDCIVAVRIDFEERPKSGQLDKGVTVVPPRRPPSGRMRGPGGR